MTVAKAIAEMRAGRLTRLVAAEISSDPVFREIVGIMEDGYDAFTSGDERRSRLYLELAKEAAGGDMGRLVRAQEAAIRLK